MLDFEEQRNAFGLYEFVLQSLQGLTSPVNVIVRLHAALCSVPTIV